MLRKAIQFMIFSAFAFALLNAFVKNLRDFSVYQIVFFRSIGTLFFTIPLILKSNISILGKNKKLLFARAFFGVISITCFFESLNYLDVGTAVSLRYTSPIFAIFFAIMFLKEKIKPMQWLLFFIAFLGVLIIKGFGTNINSVGLLLVLLSALFLWFLLLFLEELCLLIIGKFQI